MFQQSTATPAESQPPAGNCGQCRVRHAGVLQTISVISARSEADLQNLAGGSAAIWHAALRRLDSASQRADAMERHTVPHGSLHGSLQSGIFAVQQQRLPDAARHLSAAIHVLSSGNMETRPTALLSAYCWAAMSSLKTAVGDPDAGLHFAVQGMRLCRQVESQDDPAAASRIACVQGDLLTATGWALGQLSSKPEYERFLRAARHKHRSGGDWISAACDAICLACLAAGHSRWNEANDAVSQARADVMESNTTAVQPRQQAILDMLATPIRHWERVLEQCHCRIPTG
jgi:hypothetical protein